MQGTPLDFRAARELGAAELDTGYTDLERDGEDGLARVRSRAAGGERRATLWMDEGYGYLMLFTGDTLAPPRRRRGLAVEPMTCPPTRCSRGRMWCGWAPGASSQRAVGNRPAGLIRPSAA